MKGVLFADYEKLNKLNPEEVGVLLLLLPECDVLGVLSSSRVEKVCEITGLNKYKARGLLDGLREKGAIEFVGHSGLMINPNFIGITTKKQFIKERGELWANLLTTE